MTSVPADHSQAMTLLNEAMNRTLKKVLEDVAQVVGMKGDAEVDQPNPNLEDFEKPLMLTEETMMEIQRLWLILDKTGDKKISVEDFKALAGGRGEAPPPHNERRVAPNGKRYTKTEFHNFFGGYAEWDAAAPPARSANGAPGGRGGGGGGRGGGGGGGGGGRGRPRGRGW